MDKNNQNEKPQVSREEVKSMLFECFRKCIIFGPGDCTAATGDYFCNIAPEGVFLSRRKDLKALSYIDYEELAEICANAVAGSLCEPREFFKIKLTPSQDAAGERLGAVSFNMNAADRCRLQRGAIEAGISLEEYIIKLLDEGTREGGAL